MKKITFITTINHNVGDDFVREGIIYLLKKTLGKIKISTIHKHEPITTIKGLGKIRNKRIKRLINKKFPPIKILDKTLSCDILVQSGAPVYWCHHDTNTHCADNEWYNPLIVKRYLKYNNNVPFLNIGAGSCQKYNSNGQEFLKCYKCITYIRNLTKIAKITTVRDKLAKKILDQICPNNNAFLLPCPSIFASDNLKLYPQKPDYICLNYMPLGGHYRFNQDINVLQWESIFKTFYNKIKNQYKCIFVCHNKEEVEATKNLDKKANIFFSKDYKEYLKIYSKAKCGIVNRMHAAFAIASFGRPSFLIANDTRAKTVEEIGLDHEFVSNITEQRLFTELNKVLQNKDYQKTINSIKSDSYEKYLQLLQAIK